MSQFFHVSPPQQCLRKRSIAFTGRAREIVAKGVPAIHREGGYGARKPGQENQVLRMVDVVVQDDLADADVGDRVANFEQSARGHDVVNERIVVVSPIS